MKGFLVHAERQHSTYHCLCDFLDLVSSAELVPVMIGRHGPLRVYFVAHLGRSKHSDSTSLVDDAERVGLNFEDDTRRLVAVGERQANEDRSARCMYAFV